MNSSELSATVLSQFASTSNTFDPPELDEKAKRNAGRVMQEIVAQRLQHSGTQLLREKAMRYRWGQGVLLNRNSRVSSGFWTNIAPTQLDELREISNNEAAVLLFCYFDLEKHNLHTWAIPAELAIPEITSLPVTKSGSRTIAISPGEQHLTDQDQAMDIRPFYRSVTMPPAEVNALAAGIKQDVAAKELAEDEQENDDGSEMQEHEYYTRDTVDFLLELPEHTNDRDWHSANKRRYEETLRNPTRTLVESLRENPIAKLDPEVSATSRNVSILKKNDYGQGGYHDHYWAAFYAPEAGSKIKSCQLFFRMLAANHVFRYGFSFGNSCKEIVANFKNALERDPTAVTEYLRTAPPDTLVRPSDNDEDQGIDANAFADLLVQSKAGFGFGNQINIIRQFDLAELPDKADSLANEIGAFFTWVWPFFQAARTGVWNEQVPPLDDESSPDTFDEDAPQSLAELSRRSALPLEKLQSIEDALLTKQQVILTGPPGTSKTYIAAMFARYFSAATGSRVQGDNSTIFMHANWAYEDFFEGIKPFTVNGELRFAPKLGCFLEWIESLSQHTPNARHVLVLDEINRCDTAAVMGELLQLLEYRGRGVRLLSGRNFRFPTNVYIIGTMNSADRSIGRMDLALRRRFLWLDLLPDYEVLQTWLNRPGNNPSGFSSDALKECNQILENRGITPEQQVGHALFMVQTFGNESMAPEDKPLVPAALRRIVHHSVLPYVRELCVMQLGKTDKNLESQIRHHLLECVSHSHQSEALGEGHADQTNREGF